MGLPNVHVSFTEAAKHFVEKGTGIVGLILRGELPTENPIIITNADEIPSSLDETNKKQMEMAMMGLEQTPKKVIGYVIPPDETDPEEGSEPIVYDYTDALEYFSGTQVDFIAAPNVTIDNQGSAIQTWITKERADGKTVKAVLPNTEADNIGIINYATETVTVSDEESYNAAQYCARIAGVLACVPITESATFKPLEELTGASKLSKTDMDTAIDAGKFIVFWDGEKVKVGRGVNSFQTTTETMGPQFKKIHVVDIMDRIQYDIRKMAEDNYIGRFTNTYANKCLLLSAVQNYFMGLEGQGVIRLANCDIDVEANRKYLIEHDIDVSEMTDVEIREAATGDKVFLTATMTLYDAIEDIVLPITV